MAGETSSKRSPINCLSEAKQTTAERLARKAAQKCLYCGSTETLHWRDRRIICNECILKYNIGRHVPERPPQVVKKCLRCGVTYTSQWRDGPLGPSTLCNGCGVRYLRSSDNALIPEYCPKTTPSFDPDLHSNRSSPPGKR